MILTHIYTYIFQKVIYIRKWISQLNFHFKKCPCDKEPVSPLASKNAPSSSLPHTFITHYRTRETCLLQTNMLFIHEHADLQSYYSDFWLTLVGIETKFNNWYSFTTVPLQHNESKCIAIFCFHKSIKNDRTSIPSIPYKHLDL